MKIINESNIKYQLTQTESELHSNENTSLKFYKNYKSLQYLDYLYSYPPLIKVKCQKLEDGDLIKEYEKEYVDGKNPLISPQSIIDGLFAKRQSSNFFFKMSKKATSSLPDNIFNLNAIQVFAVFNGNGEIVLGNPSNVLSPKTIKSFIDENLYVDPTEHPVEKELKLGLFFMDKLGAENYLKEVAISDFEGTQTLGLCVNCIGLDSAYKITREHHPEIDFRFVPNFNEVKKLLGNNIDKSNIIFEDKQQQLKKKDYFKGVPIYVVQLNETPKKGQIFDFGPIPLRHNGSTQRSLKDAGDSEKFENFIFFEKDQALKFRDVNEGKVVRFNDGRHSNLVSMIRKPKIFVYNLEDFIEDWEDEFKGYDWKGINYFISPNLSVNNKEILKTSTLYSTIEVANNSEQMNTSTYWRQTLNVKLRSFKRAVGIFFSLN